VPAVGQKALVRSEADLEQRAQAGDASARLKLGRLLLDGTRAGADGRRGLALIEEAADAGDGDATAMTALFEAMGVNRPADWNRAFDRLQLAAERGSSSARLQLGLLARNSGGSSWSGLRKGIDLPALLRSGDHKALSEAPRVRVIEQFASPAESRWLVERARERLRPASVFHPGTGALSYQLARTNSGAEFQIADMDLVFEMIRARISAAVRMPLPQFEPTQILHYSPGQQFRPHFDFMDPANPAYREQLRMGQRIGTFLIYLNEGFEGGETEFVDAALRFKGRTGDAIFWANVDSQRRPDPLTRHAGLPPTSGEKWILSQWIRDRSGPVR
jgi:prolyl 4-hydroxylase